MTNSERIIFMKLLPKITDKIIESYLTPSMQSFADEMLEDYSSIRDIGLEFHNFSEKAFHDARIKCQTILRKCHRNQIEIICYLDDNYPTRLMNLPDKPLILFYKGDYKLLSLPNVVAVVGTRTPSIYGGLIANHLGKQLANMDSVVVSGLAIGCDTEVHRGCLLNNGKTVAVLGGGLDRIYPKENIDLAKEILDKGGLLISEYWPGQSISKRSLVFRDRIQSGLSDAVVVVETGLIGGTMHTVKYAFKQARRVYVIVHPDQYVSPVSEGNRKLLERKAVVPIQSFEDLKSLFSRQYLKSKGIQQSIFDYIAESE